MNKELPKVYEPQQVESRIYQMWEDARLLQRAMPDPKKKPFSIVMPPPNVTGQLHMGHALDCTLQDILTRFKRMQGYAALWVPGTDHAGIATQIKVEEELRVKEGLTRYDLGREKFLERVWKWKEKYGNRIVASSRRRWAFPATGAAPASPWTRAAPRPSGRPSASCTTRASSTRAAASSTGAPTASPPCPTRRWSMWTSPATCGISAIPWPTAPAIMVVATTRPETMMGDTGVAVNPEDEQFKHLIGKTCILPIMNREIPIVGDEYCEIGFGTGAVKMTPAHDPNDFEVGLRHNLEVIRCHRRRRSRSTKTAAPTMAWTATSAARPS